LLAFQQAKMMRIHLKAKERVPANRGLDADQPQAERFPLFAVWKKLNFGVEPKGTTKRTRLGTPHNVDLTPRAARQ
jgi:hypothetical protein